MDVGAIDYSGSRLAECDTVARDLACCMAKIVEVVDAGLSVAHRDSSITVIGASEFESGD